MPSVHYPPNHNQFISRLLKFPISFEEETVNNAQFLSLELFFEYDSNI